MKQLKRPDTIVLASRNSNKIEELHAILRKIGIKLKSSLDFPQLNEVEETADTLEGNAYLKALYTFESTGLPSLADDTGLEVEALNGRPGVKSARYSGEKATYKSNMYKLLEEMELHENRRAQFRTSLVYISEEGSLVFHGVSKGVILREPKGDKGFGYDPVFMPDGMDKTFAELSAEEKNKISHRARAVQEFVRFIKSIKK